MTHMENQRELHVLLTNDDGHQAPGILALQAALQDRGHRVSMVAPSAEQSATGMSMTSRRNLTLSQLDNGNWHLDGQPVDTVLVALRHLLQDDPPDLVLSGINFGPNLGIGLHLSGTVGAAVMASLNGFPSIAVSAGMLFHEYGSEPIQFPSTHDVLAPAAQFTCSVIDNLCSTHSPGDPMLPAGILLNINYPAMPSSEIKGVLYPEVSGGHMIEMGYSRCEESGGVIPQYYAGVDPDQPNNEQGDVRAHLEGYITISPVKPQWNPPDQDTQILKQRLNGLSYR